MSLIAQTSLLLAICFVSEAVFQLLKLPIPGNVLGMILLFVLLCARIVKPEHISRVSDAILSNMTILFVPSAAALMVHYQVIAERWVGFLVAIIVSSLLTFAVTGRLAQRLLLRKTRPETKSSDLSGAKKEL